MLEEKNNHEQDSTDQELDDLLKDFREQDDLHARIQQFKKKKAAADIRQEEVPFSQPFQQPKKPTTTPALDQLKTIHSEEEAGDTTVISVEEEELEKTKVIPTEPEESADANATLIISEDDMRQLVEEEERKKQQKKQEKEQGEKARKSKMEKSSLKSVRKEEGDEASNDRLNKIITYVIIGLVSIALLVGIVFAAYSFLSSDSAPQEDQQQETDQTSTDEEKDTGSETQITTNNDKEISEINGQIQSYQDEISHYQNLISQENTKLEEARTAFTTADSNYNTILAQLNSTQSQLDQLNGQLANASEEEKASIQAQIDVLKPHLTSINSQFEQAGYARQNAQREYESLQGTTSANISDYNARISELNSQISDLQNRLAQLQ